MQNITTGRIDVKARNEKQIIFDLVHEYYFPKFKEFRRMYGNVGTQSFMGKYWVSLINNWEHNRCDFFKHYKFKLIKPDWSLKEL